MEGESFEMFSEIIANNFYRSSAYNLGEFEAKFLDLRLATYFVSLFTFTIILNFDNSLSSIDQRITLNIRKIDLFIVFIIEKLKKIYRLGIFCRISIESSGYII